MKRGGILLVTLLLASLIVAAAEDFDSSDPWLALQQIAENEQGQKGVDLNKNSIIDNSDRVGGLTTSEIIDQAADTDWVEANGNVYRTSGNVGIGTTSPQSVGDGGGPTILQLHSTTSTNGGIFQATHSSTAAGTTTGGLSFGITGLTANEKRIAGIYATKTDASTSVGTGDLRFFTWNGGVSGERMTIKSNGNVGIGTTTPASLLHVFKSDSSGVVLDGSTGNSLFSIARNGGTKAIYGLAGAADQLIADTAVDDLAIRSNQRILFSSDEGVTAQMVIQNSGNVGIGTNNPSLTFEVDSKTQNTGGVAAFLSTGLTDTQTAPFILGRNKGNDQSVNLQYTYDTTAADQKFSIDFYGGANDGIVLDGAGNVGIGTNQPGEKLEVTGNILTKGRIAVGSSSNDGRTSGIWLWSNNDPNHAIYSANSQGKSPAGNSPVPGFWDTFHRLRFRTAASQGFLWEGDNEQRVMDLTADTGDLWVKGKVASKEYCDQNGENCKSASTSSQGLYTKTITVAGDKNTFYPVVLKFGNQDRIDHVRIYRGYEEAGPTGISGQPTTNHIGGLTLEIDTNYGAWGGSTYDWRVMDLRQTYIETFADAQHCMHNIGFCMKLRGGGFVYHIESEKPLDNLQIAYDANTLIYDHAQNQYDVKAPAPVTTPNYANIKAHSNENWNFIKDNPFSVDNANNVGLGTSTPEGKLQILNPNTGSDYIALRVTQDDPQNWGITTKGRYGLDIRSANAWALRSAGGGKATFDGLVGIGTTSPSTKLHVQDGHVYIGDDNTFNNPGNWDQTINLDSNVHARILIEERATGTQAALWAHTGGNARVGTVSNHDFGIVAGNSEKIHVKTDGRVGIGEGAPIANLHINDFGVADDGRPKLRVGAGTISGKATVDIITNDGTDSLRVFSDNDRTNPRLIVKRGGYVGLGTPTPEEILEIKNDRPVISLHEPGVSTFKLGNDGGVFKIAAMDNGKGGHVGNFEANDDQTLTMKTDGTVGIGTVTPTSKVKLNVLGKVGATEYCDADGNNCKRASDLGTASSEPDDDWTIAGTDINRQSGEVGIGITNPTARFHINQDGGGWNDGIRIQESSNYFDIITDLGGQRLWIAHNSNPGRSIALRNGRVGINNGDPQKTLDVTGNLRASTSTGRVWLHQDFKNNHPLELGSNVDGYVGALKMWAYDQNNFVFLRPSNGNYHVDSTRGQYYFNWDEGVRGANNGQIHMADEAGNEDIRLNTAGTSWFTGGNVGIGTGTAIYPLVVNRGNYGQTIRAQAADRYMDIYPHRDWAHFLTNAPKYYFDKEIRVNSGKIGSYDEDLQLATQGTTRMTITRSGDADLSNRQLALGRIYLRNSAWHGWGNSIIDGRVWSGSNNLHLSPPGGAAVIIDANYRDAGGGGGDANLFVDGRTGLGTTTLSSDLRLDVEGKIGATQYCDQNGQNCKTVQELAAGGDGEDTPEGTTTGLVARYLEDSDNRDSVGSNHIINPANNINSYSAAVVNNGVTITPLSNSDTNKMFRIPENLFRYKYQYSLTFWMKTSDNNGGIFSGAGGGNDNEFLMYLYSDGKAKLFIHNVVKFTTNPINDGKWHHIAITKTPSELALYVDGAFIGKIADGSANYVEYLYFGQEQDRSGSSYIFDRNQQLNIQFDDIRVYNRGLGAGEVAGFVPTVDSDGDWKVDGANMYSEPSGNVGIGDSTPDAKLDVEGDVLVSGKLGVGGITPDVALDVKGDIQSNNKDICLEDGTNCPSVVGQGGLVVGDINEVTINSASQWKIHDNTATGWTEVNFDDSSWNGGFNSVGSVCQRPSGANYALWNFQGSSFGPKTFRTTFRLNGPAVRGNVQISAHTQYDLFVNGRRVTSCRPTTTSVCSDIDNINIVRYLQEGKNVIAIQGYTVTGSQGGVCARLDAGYVDTATAGGVGGTQIVYNCPTACQDQAGYPTGCKANAPGALTTSSTCPGVQQYGPCSCSAAPLGHLILFTPR